MPTEHTEASEGPRLLWRLESPTELLVQYPVRPDPTWLLPGARSRPKAFAMQQLMDSLAAGQRWDFVLAANTVRRSTGRARARQAQAQRVSAREWLTGETDVDADSGTSRAYQSGFRVLAIAETTQRRGGPRQAHLVRITGRLEVEDTEALQAALEEGIGRGKAQGAGMLSLSPLPRG
ncbi:type I-E CRISPR-associated protein Cas6/Cse3/CasE [Streptomyces sp. NBRC 109706]|uniref:type I-E CRISPR-associated protein Cas6/Cse3/CasE n=1 Tax=Streptomyces sp. NBRC 109706 TaxID=1550035 RepID=UPI001F379EE4|nr:type I-E CRISPR-associated protein Cas6/Cse3/CasE [Streptomyces sp. NBRC 109706]